MNATLERHEAYYRRRDGELAGYLREAGANGLVVPVSLLGHSLAEPGPRAEAEAVLELRGLETLAAVWWALAPEDLQSGEIDLRRPEPDWIWRRFVVTELSSGVARIRLHFAAPGELSVLLTVTVPADDVLHDELPE